MLFQTLGFLKKNPPRMFHQNQVRRHVWWRISCFCLLKNSCLIPSPHIRADYCWCTFYSQSKLIGNSFPLQSSLCQDNLCKYEDFFFSVQRKCLCFKQSLTIREHVASEDVVLRFVEQIHLLEKIHPLLARVTQCLFQQGQLNNKIKRLISLFYN